VVWRAGDTVELFWVGDHLAGRHISWTLKLLPVFVPFQESKLLGNFPGHFVCYLRRTMRKLLYQPPPPTPILIPDSCQPLQFLFRRCAYSCEAGGDFMFLSTLFAVIYVRQFICLSCWLKRLRFMEVSSSNPAQSTGYPDRIFIVLLRVSILG
jgi:hypothetical protein